MKSSIGTSAMTLDMSNEYPLRIIADPRFQMIITRAIQRTRVAPVLERDITQSERSSWSSASVVSSTDLKSPEPISQNELIEK
jgi:hypothetical protein